MIGRWLAAGGGNFHNTRGLVLAGALLTWGVQWVLAVLFISIFASRLGRARTGVRMGELLSDGSDLDRVDGASAGTNQGESGLVL
jgi:hypothetical protein